MVTPLAKQQAPTELICGLPLMALSSHNGSSITSSSDKALEVGDRRAGKKYMHRTSHMKKVHCMYILPLSILGSPLAAGQRKDDI